MIFCLCIYGLFSIADSFYSQYDGFEGRNRLQDFEEYFTSISYVGILGFIMYIAYFKDRNLERTFYERRQTLTQRKLEMIETKSSGAMCAL